MKLKFPHHQDQTCHHKGSGLKVTPLNSLLVMQMKVLRQEVQLRMIVCITSFLSQEEPKKVEDAL